MLKSSSTIFHFMALMPLFFAIASCSDRESSINLNGDKSDIMAMLQSQDITQRASIPSDNFIFISEKETIVTAEPNSFIFEQSGALATGNIDFEMIELFTKSEILQYGIQTKSNNSIIASDGEFFFSASQNGQALQLADGKALSLSVPNPNPNFEMELFEAGEGAWLPSRDSLDTFVSNSVDGFNGYAFSFNRLDWVNIDYFTKFDLARTDISIRLPDEYSDNSIFSWIVFRDLDVVLFSRGDNLPIGEIVSIVSILAVEKNKFSIAIQEVTIEEGLSVNLSPKLETSDNIKDLLKALD